VSLRN
jgi:hypothetical protein